MDRIEGKEKARNDTKQAEDPTRVGIAKCESANDAVGLFQIVLQDIVTPL